MSNFNHIAHPTNLVAARQPLQDPSLTTASSSSAMFTSPIRSHLGSSQQSKPSPQSLPFVPLDNVAIRQANFTTHSGFPSPQINPYDQPNSDIFFQARTNYQPVQYHLYSSLPPNRKNLARNERTAHDFFINDALRETLQKKQAASLQTLPSSNLPQTVHVYHSLVPLDIQAEKSNKVLGYASWIYKAINRQDGHTYALRRIGGFKLVNEASIGLVEKWRKLVCANVVSVNEAFTTKAFGDDSIVFVHEYHPLSTTLYDLHYGRNTRKFSNSAVIGEQLIFSYLTQLINALRVIHGKGLSCRVADASKILVTEKNRLRINCCGVMDVLAYTPEFDLKRSQALDLTNIAKIILGIAMNDHDVSTREVEKVDLTSRGYSGELQLLLKKMLQEDTDPASMLNEVVSALATHSMQNMDAGLRYNDTLEGELGRETENGRLVRLLCKFGFINERPEFEHDPAWSETGERYVLKLFRDYVFHQVNEQGLPIVDLGHVLLCLNKLDAGIDERISLISRDEQTCIVISYKELKRCAEQAFYSLTHAQKKNK